MNAQLPHPHEARQLCRLRGLRVQRSREQVVRMQEQLDKAAQALREREQRIERLRGEVTALRHAIVGALAPVLPRWSRITVAQQERLDDQLERQEFALREDEHALEGAQEHLQEARAELTRALAREDAVRGLAKQAQHAHLLAQDQRAERDLDDQLSAGRRVST